jgi:hypothetical protein
MRREFSFVNLGRVVISLCVLFYAGYISPLAQAWSDPVLCPYSMSMGHSHSVSMEGCLQGATNSDDVDAVCCHAPDSTDSISISQFSVDWAPLVPQSAMIMLEKRIRFNSLPPEIEVPDFSLDSPPPRKA